MNRLVPDYFTMIQGSDLNPILGFLWFVIQLYGTMIIFVALNALLTAAIFWFLLIVCRFLGIPWIDGTTEGIINRR